jgi:hypothetical protein
MPVNANNQTQGITMRYMTPTMLTADDQRRILSLLDQVKEAIDGLLEVRNLTQDTYLPKLKAERTLEHDVAAIGSLKTTP